MPDPAGRPLALADEGLALVDRLGPATSEPVHGLADGLLEQPVVDRLGERLEEGRIELVLPDHDVVLADDPAALLVIDASVHRDAPPRRANAVRPRHGDQGAATR